MINKQKVINIWVSFIFLISALSIFFIPPVVSIGSMSLRIDDILVLSIMPLSILFFYKFIEINVYTKILIATFLSMFVSNVFGYLFLDVPYSSGDTNELIRMLKPLFIFSFLLLIDKKVFIELFFKFLIIAMIIFIFIGLSESLKIPYLYEFFTNIYSSNYQSGIGRINTTTLNPNDGAVITLFFLFFSVSMLVVYKKYYYFITSLALIYILLNTGSRTSFLVAILFFIVFFIFMKSIEIKHKIFILFIMIIFIILMYPYLENYIERVKTLFDAFKLEDESLNIRFRLWNEALALFYDSKILGWGIAKSIHNTTVDGEYFILLRRYGIVGLGLVILAMIYPLYIIKNKMKLINLDTKEKVILFTLFWYILAGFFIMFTNSFFTNYILVFPFILLLVILFSKDQNKCIY